MPGASQHLVVTTSDAQPVQFTISTTTGVELYTEKSSLNKTTVVDLGTSFQVEKSSDRLGGIQIFSHSKMLVVYGINYQPYTSDTFLALPYSEMEVSEYKYFAVSYGSASGPNQVLLVACKDNTTVVYGDSKVLLNKAETFLLEDTADITGKQFVSNKPISFFSGHLCTYIPHNVLACDHIIEQFPPTAVWGKRFLLASLYGRISGDIYRVVTASHSNTIQVLCTRPYSYVSYKFRLNLVLAGDWEELKIPAGYFCTVQGSSPLLVVQFGLAHRSDYVGDPFMMMIPSVEHYGNLYTVRALSGFSKSFLTILVTNTFFKPEEIFVDEEHLGSVEWYPISCPNERVCGYAAYVAVSEGDHRVYHSNAVSNIGVLVYGFDSFNSYGHPAGLQFIPDDRKDL